jgi:2Fe-2S ferredoxin
MTCVTFITIDGRRMPAQVQSGSTVLEAAHANDVPMLGTCGGSLVCGTCHVKIGADARAQLTPPSEDEEDTLDLAFGVCSDSRLGCQVKIDDALEGVEIRLAPTMQSG